MSGLRLCMSGLRLLRLCMSGLRLSGLRWDVWSEPVTVRSELEDPEFGHPV